MSKKKHKKNAGRQGQGHGGWGETGYGAMGNMESRHAASAANAPGSAQPSLQGNAMSGLGLDGLDRGLLHGLQGIVGARHTEQFILGALIGAGAAWLLSDEALRGKLVKAGMKLYAGIAGGFEEMKEQVADIKAEVEAERFGEK